jgi:hypothetical protein
MGGGVDGLEVLDRHVRVALRRGELRVTEHLLDEADVGAPFQHQRRHGVAEEVARPTLAKLRRLHIAPHQGTEVVRVERVTPGGEEQGAASRGADIPYYGTLPY